MTGSSEPTSSGTCHGGLALIVGSGLSNDPAMVLPVVDRLDRSLDGLREAHPEFTISVIGLTATLLPLDDCLHALQPTIRT